MINELNYIMQKYYMLSGLFIRYFALLCSRSLANKLERKVNTILN
jgi:hypothetical protein